MQGLHLAEARRAAEEADTGPLTKRITDQRTLQRWKQSAAHAKLLRFISELGDAVVGRRVSAACEERPIVRALIAEFDTMSGWVDEITPLQQAMRYGNKAFKTWHERLTARAPTLIAELLERYEPVSTESAPPSPAAAAELAAYYVGSFGSPTRIDYGDSRSAPCPRDARPRDAA